MRASICVCVCLCVCVHICMVQVHLCTRANSCTSPKCFNRASNTHRSVRVVRACRLYIPPVCAGRYCLTVHFNMFGFHTGSLSVSVQSHTLWSLSGPQGRQWLRRSVDVTLQDGDQVRSVHSPASHGSRLSPLHKYFYDPYSFKASVSAPRCH